MQAFDRKPRTSRTRPLGLAGAAIAIGSTAATAEAGTILSPTAVVSNSMGDSSTASLDIGNVIDQSGLSSGFTSGTTDYSTYLLTLPTHSTNAKTGVFWQSLRESPTGSIVFDLGDEFSIERVAIWQASNSSTGGSQLNIQDIMLQTSSDLAFTSPSPVESLLVPRDEGVGPVNDFDLTDSVGRYVRLTIDSNYGDSLGRTNFGEIAFDVSAATAVPEPGSGFLLLFTAGVALMFRRLWRHV